MSVRVAAAVCGTLLLPLALYGSLLLSVALFGSLWFLWLSCSLVLSLGLASEASEQSERAKLSGAFSRFPLLTYAFAGVPWLSVASFFACCLAFSFEWCLGVSMFLKWDYMWRSILHKIALPVPC